jgi:hypothetical protein
LFDIGAAVGFVLDNKNNAYDRAIKLYELMIAIHLCKGKPYDLHEKSEPTRFSVIVSSKDICDARHFAVIQLMGYLHKTSSFKARFRRSSPVLGDMLNIEFRNLYNGAFLQNGGWRRILSLPTAREFQLSINEAHVTYIGQLIDFSMRFKPNPLKPHQKGGITMALAITQRQEVVVSDHSAIPERRTALGARWKKLQPVAVFSYLTYIQRLGMWPPGLTNARFPERLLKAVRRQSQLQNLIFRYNEACDRLTERGYTFKRLTMGGIPTDAGLIISPLHPQVEQLVDDYTGPE